MNLCVSSWAHTSTCSHTCREHVEYMCTFYIHIDLLSSHFPHMSVRCYTHTLSLFCVHSISIYGWTDNMYGSLFEHVAHALVIELIWDLKSGRCRAGKASQMADCAWFASMVCHGLEALEPLSCQSVAQVGPESSHPCFSCLWGMSGWVSETF